jgi:uncharacterized protein (DUF58 family)
MADDALFEQPTAVLQQAAVAAAGYRLRLPAALSHGPAGSHLGTGSGTSIDFQDFREYQPGDDLRRVDWGGYARHDTLMVRLFRVEIAPVSEIILDTSASMGFYPGKRAAALCTAAFLAGITRRAEGRPVLVTRRGRHPGAAVEETLARLDFTDAYDGPAAPGVEGGRTEAMRFLISDFLVPEDLEAVLARYARSAAQLVLVPVLALSERDPRPRGGRQLIDAEDETRLLNLHVDAAAVADYRRRLTKHLGSLREAAARLRSPVATLEVPDPFDGAEAVVQRTVGALVRAGVVEAL